MNFVLQGLRHYRRAYIGVLLGAALGAMVLLGSLFSGDSVRHTLATVAEQRSGQIRRAVTAGENFFRARLADDLGGAVAPLLQLQGQIDTPDGRTTGQVDLLGVVVGRAAFGRVAGRQQAELLAEQREQDGVVVVVRSGAHQALHHFVAKSPWDEWRLLRSLVASELAGADDGRGSARCRDRDVHRCPIGAADRWIADAAATTRTTTTERSIVDPP
jgi:hypothetical protein